jgi:hypothetical protein
MKFSGLYRRRALDASMPGLSSYFSRRRDGILIPTLNLSMRGDKNLFLINILSKMLKYIYLLRNI